MAAQVIAHLATEGVEVYVSATSPKPIKAVTAPAVPIKILESQAEIDAAETVNHSGTLGSSLNSLMTMPTPPPGQSYPSFDYLLAAYAVGTKTAGEKLAGELLGTQDWSEPNQIVFPDLVLTLFTADALRAAEKGSTSVAAAAAAAVSASVIPAGSICASLSDWVSSAFSAVFAALTVGPSSNPVLSFIGSIWNAAVTLAGSALGTIAGALTAPVLSAIRVGIGTIGVAA